MNNLLDKYQIPKFLQVHDRYKFPDEKSKHTADVAISYYLYAYYQFISYTDIYVAFFKKSSPNHDEVMSSLRESWSHAFGMYVLLRTALEALGIMRKMVGDMSPVDPFYGEHIRRICDIANDLIKHPTFKHGFASEASEPQALGMNGEIDFVVWSNAGILKEKVSFRPSGDFDIVHDYFEYLADRLLSE